MGFRTTRIRSRRSTNHIRAKVGSLSKLAVLGALFALPLACSLVIPSETPCTSSSDCRAAFGAATTCGASGFCNDIDQLARCTETYPSDLFSNPIYNDALVIASMYAADSQLDTQRATQLAVVDVDEAGGLDGRPVGLVQCDYSDGLPDGLTTDEALVAITRYLRDELNVPVVIGPRGSGNATVVYEELDGAELVIISPSASSPLLTELDGDSHSDESPGFLWRTVPPDDLQAQTIAADMLERAVGSVAVIYESGSYGDSLLDLFDGDFGGSIDAFPYVDATRDIGGITAQVTATEYDEILFIASTVTDTVAFFNSTVATNSLQQYFEARNIFLTDSGFDERLLTETNAAARAMLLRARGTRPAPDTSSTNYRAFAANYSLFFDAPAETSTFTPHAYDAGWIALLASTWSQANEGEVTGLGIARGLRQLSSGPEVHLGRGALELAAEAFAAGGGIDVVGTSGPLDFDPVTEETTGLVAVWIIQERGPDLAFETLE